MWSTGWPTSRWRLRRAGHGAGEAVDAQAPEPGDGGGGAAAGDGGRTGDRWASAEPQSKLAGAEQSAPCTADRGGRETARAAEENAKEAERQKQKADAMFRAAKSTVDTYLTRVSEEKLLKEPRLQPLRKELLGLALDYYLGFIKKRADDPSVRKDLADACIRAGDVYHGHLHGPRRKPWEANTATNEVRGVALYEELVRENQGSGTAGRIWRIVWTARKGHLGGGRVCGERWKTQPRDPALGATAGGGPRAT